MVLKNKNLLFGFLGNFVIEVVNWKFDNVRPSWVASRRHEIIWFLLTLCPRTTTDLVSGGEVRLRARDRNRG